MCSVKTFHIFDFKKKNINTFYLCTYKMNSNQKIEMQLFPHYFIMNAISEILTCVSVVKATE